MRRSEEMVERMAPVRLDIYACGECGADHYVLIPIDPKHVTDEDYLTPKEIADILSVSEVTAASLCRRGDIRAYRIGHRWRVAKSDWTRYLSSLAGGTQ